jgi:tetratricopeptide (TPR) repeat protein
VFNTLNFNPIVELLLQQNSSDKILMFVGGEILFWIVTSFIFLLFLPKKYQQYKKEIFLFFVVINIGLLFIGILLTLIMVLFGLSWATHRVSRPNYESVNLEEHISEFPVVYSKFQEGILTIEGEHTKEISTDEKIKSLRILYDSNAEGNIEKIKHFLADSSDETRLYAFALISSFEKKLNTRIKEVQKKIEKSEDEKERNQHRFELAITYWQFIFHGVASEKLSGFYTKKIEQTLEEIQNLPSAFVLLGKIHIFNKEYTKAEASFLKAVELGLPKESIFTFLAEIKFAQKKYNEVANYISHELFAIDIRLKPLAETWVKS